MKIVFRCALLCAAVACVGFAVQVAARVRAGFSFPSAGVEKLRLSRPTDSVVLAYPVAVDRRRLQEAISVLSPSGVPMPSVIFVGADGRYRLKAPATDGGYTLHIGDGLSDNRGRPYEGARSIEVRWDAAPREVRLTPKSRLFYGVNNNSSPNSPTVVAEWAKELGVGFVRMGWGSAGPNPQCKPLVLSDQWHWQAFDAKIDAYQRAGLKVLLVPLQFTTSPCGNGGSTDPRAILDSPERYGEYVEGLVGHVMARNPGVVIAVELGNEPDVGHFWVTADRRRAPKPDDATAYFKYLEAGSLAVRRVEARTGQKVVVMNGGFGVANMAWWRSLVRQPGLGDLVDALSVHLYPWAGPPPAMQPPAHNSFDDYFAEVSAAQQAGLGDKPIWVTELGLQSSPSCPWAVDEVTQAVLLENSVEFFAKQTAPRVAAVSLFTIQDDIRDRPKLNPLDPVSNCYILQGLGLRDDSGRARPAFAAFVKRIANRSPRVR